MKTYFSDPKSDKAMTILAAMSPDMVADIVDLVQREGRRLITLSATADKAPMRPLAIFSSRFIPDEDFKEVFLGISTLWIGSMRKLDSDNDKYKKILESAFQLPPSMAENIAKSIETLDVIGGKADPSRLDWIKLQGARFQETIRKLANWAPSVFQLGWENDQTQKYDLDFLYEMKLLGQAVDKLNSRFGLMGAQARIANEMALFQGAKGIYGDAEDLLSGDPHLAAEYELGAIVNPANGSDLPGQLYGGFGAIVAAGKQALSKAVKNYIAKAQGKAGDGQVDVPKANALTAMTSGNQNPVLQLIGNTSDLSKLRLGLEALQGVKIAGDIETLYGDIYESYGPEVADAWRSNDIPAAMAGVIRLAGEPLGTTGDTQLDEELVGDAMEEGDFEGSLDPELGGLFKKARARWAIKRGNRRRRKAMRRASKESEKNRKEAELLAAREFANSQGLTEDMVKTPEQWLAEINARNTAAQNTPAMDLGMPQATSYYNNLDMSMAPAPQASADLMGMEFFPDAIPPAVPVGNDVYNNETYTM